MEVSIVWEYKAQGTKKRTTFTSQMMTAQEALRLAKDVEKTGVNNYKGKKPPGIFFFVTKV